MKNRPDENIAVMYHKLSKDRSMGGKVFIPQDPDFWPESWKKVEYKTYNSILNVSLLPQKDCNIDMSLSSVLEQRRSSRNFKERGHSLTLREISVLLANSVAITGGFDEERDPKENGRMYPSGGGVYPIEVYVLVNRSMELRRGIYHYSFLKHSLEFIAEISNDIIGRVFYYKWAQSCAGAIFLTSVFYRNFEKYGERGYRYVLFEAGHIAQNLYLSSGALELAVCAVGGVDDESIEDMIGLDGEHESVVYTIALG